MPKLLRKYDIRDIDWGTGERIPLPYEDMHECHRCTRRHAIIYEVQMDDLSVVEIGSGCKGRVLAGWRPSAAEERAANQALEEQIRAAERAKIQEIVELIMPHVLRAPPPPVRLINANDDAEAWGWTQDQLPANPYREDGLWSAPTRCLGTVSLRSAYSTRRWPESEINVFRGRVAELAPERWREIRAKAACFGHPKYLRPRLIAEVQSRLRVEEEGK